MNKIFILLICSGLAFGIVCGISAPLDVLAYENRYANKPKALSLRSYLSGSFQDSFELALADQLPGAEQAREEYNRGWSAFSMAILSNFAQSIAQDTPLEECANQDPVLIISDDAFGEGAGVETVEAKDAVELSAKPEAEEPQSAEPEAPAVQTEPAEPEKAEEPKQSAESEKEAVQPETPVAADTSAEQQSAPAEEPKTESEQSSEKTEEPVEAPATAAEPEAESPAEETPAETPTPVDSGKYISLGNGFYLYNDHILEGTVTLEGVRKRGDRFIAGYNNLIDKHPELNFYLFYVEKESDYNFVTGRRSGFFEYICENLHIPADHASRLNVTNFTDFSSWYYKSDHHWAYKGSYRGYEIMISMLKPGEAILLPQDELYIGRFAGSLTKTKATANYYDDFMAYEFNFPEMDITVSKKKSDYGAQASYIAKARDGKKQSLSYGGFYGPDAGEIVIHNPSGSGNLLIFGNSYDNAVIKLLASHYENTYSIDMRYYSKLYGKSFVFEDYIKDKEIDDVIHIGNANYFVQSTFVIDR